MNLKRPPLVDRFWPPRFRVHFEMEKQLHPRVSIVRTESCAQLPAKLGLRFLIWPVCTSIYSSKNRLKESGMVGSKYMVYNWESQRHSHALRWD